MQPYILEPNFPNDIHRVERWNNRLYNGRAIDIIVHAIFESGSFDIKLTPEDVMYIENRENIEISQFTYSTRALGNIYYYKLQILNDYIYDTNEIVEINKMIYGNDDHCSSCIRSEIINRDFMYDKFWVLEKETYEVCRGCYLQKN